MTCRGGVCVYVELLREVWELYNYVLQKFVFDTFEGALLLGSPGPFSVLFG